MRPVCLRAALYISAASAAVLFASASKSEELLSAANNAATSMESCTACDGGGDCGCCGPRCSIYGQVDVLFWDRVGTGCDEVIHSILDVMYTNQPYRVIQRAMHIHPTVSELLPTMLGDLQPPDSE